MHNWQHITSDQRILDIVQGCKIDFNAPVQEPRNNFRSKFSDREAPVIEKELEKLLQMGAIKRVPWLDKGFVSSIFTTPKKDGSTNMIFEFEKIE